MHQPGVAEKGRPLHLRGEGASRNFIVTNGERPLAETRYINTRKISLKFMVKAREARNASAPERLAVLPLGVFRILRFL